MSMHWLPGIWNHRYSWKARCIKIIQSNLPCSFLGLSCRSCLICRLEDLRTILLLALWTEGFADSFPEIVLFFHNRFIPSRLTSLPSCSAIFGLAALTCCDDSRIIWNAWSASCFDIFGGLPGFSWPERPAIPEYSQFFIHRLMGSRATSKISASVSSFYLFALNRMAWARWRIRKFVLVFSSSFHWLMSSCTNGLTNFRLHFSSLRDLRCDRSKSLPHDARSARFFLDYFCIIT